MLFFGTAMSITAFPVLARILTDRGLHRTRIGGLALAGRGGRRRAGLDAAGRRGRGRRSGSGHSQLRLALAPVYAAVMILAGAARLLRKLAAVYERQGRLTPNVLAAVLGAAAAVRYATDWMGVKFIFGAFIFGIVMPQGRAAALREAILERLEQVSVLVLLPVFFVVAGLNVDLSGIGAVRARSNSCLIMVVAVGGKFGGAYVGARLTGVRPRQAGALAALMNTRGLTELVILTVGLQLGILDTVAVHADGGDGDRDDRRWPGRCCKLIYPNRIMERDIAEADRAALGQAAAHRIVVLIDDPETRRPLGRRRCPAGRQPAAQPAGALALVPHRRRPPGGGRRARRRAAGR